MTGTVIADSKGGAINELESGRAPRAWVFIMALSLSRYRFVGLIFQAA